ncbi:MAG TPA: phosphotransferase [bacterium]|nr:phosphotransferase [bacterium]HOC88754.1 phosphotransferase [bacterium]HOZ22115.1 phosphotransferase [bacterium]
METILLEKLFRKCYGETPDRINPLKGDGSERRIYRMQNVYRSVIGVAGDNRPENEAFYHFSSHFAHYHLPVPAIYAAELENGIYLEQDLGFFTLYEWMQPLREKEGFGPTVMAMYEKVLYWLPRFQITAGRTIDYSFCYQHALFGRESMLWDLRYFQHRFLAPFYTAALDNGALGEDFARLVKHLLEVPADSFLYRDFQSRNVMILDNEPHFIDYQSGRRGALQYDVASLLFDAKADIPQSAREVLLDYYLTVLNEVEAVDESRFKGYFYSFVLMRVLQALGAYGYLAAVKGKRNFLKSVPYALGNLEILLQKAAVLEQLPTLRSVFVHLINDPALREIK